MDLADLLERARERGFTLNFSCHDDSLRCRDSGTTVAAKDAWIVGEESVDQGTDPGDDATIYLIETREGVRGYVIIGTSFHADPRDAAFIDRLARRH